MPIVQLSPAELAAQKGAEGFIYQDATAPGLLFARGTTGNLIDNPVGGLSAAQVSSVQGAYSAGLWNLSGTPAAGLVDGVETSSFVFTADTSERIIGLAVVFNAASDQQAAEQIAAGLYSVYPLDSSETLALMSPGAVIERVAVVALSSTTYTTGFCISASETTVADILAALRFIVAPTAETVTLNIGSVPTYAAGLVTGATATITFAEAA